MPIPMVALKALKYASKHLQPGDEFEARGTRDARLLIAIRKADFALAPAEPLAAPVAADAIPAPAQEPAAPAQAEETAAAPVADTEPASAAGPVVEASEADTNSATESAVDQAAAGEVAPGEIAAIAGEPQADTEISARTGKPKRQYKRRDMQAED